ncbi:tetratricopeptide repeat protein [Patescibacteria group bacterium]|nr:tetratricopeptide repeat protein [Patescibacteria group bacterium]
MKSKKKGKQSKTQPEKIAPKLKNVKDIFEFLKENKKILLVFLVIILLVYANIINGEFVTADDPEIFRHVNSHTFVESLKTLHIPKIYMGTMNELFGLNPTAFHVASILMHLINTVLALCLTYMMTEDKKLSILATLVFCVHPAGSEAISWISGRAYLFLFLFGAVIMIFYFLYRNSGNKNYLAASTLIYIFTLIFWRIPWILVIFALLVGIDQLYLNKKIDFSKIKTYMLFIISSGLYGASEFIGRYTQRVESLEAKYKYDPVSTTPLINRIPYTIYMAARQLVWPMELTIYHEGKIITQAIYTFMILVSILVVGSVIYFWNKDRKTSVLIILIFLAIGPTFSPVVVAWFIADRYLYLPALLFGILISRILMKIEKEQKSKDLAVTAIVILIIFYGIRTAVRTNDFKTNKNLWLATKKTSPFSRRVYNNLGDVYSKEGNWALAIENFKRSVEISPNYAEAIHNLGFTYMQAGDLENAKKYLMLSYQKNPTIFQALYKLGLIARHEGDYELALQYMNKALEIVPDDAQIKATASQIQQEMEQNSGVSIPQPQPVPAQTKP